MKKYWVCMIGPVEEKDLPDGADFPPRWAAKQAVCKMLEEDNTTCWSGWMDENKRAEELPKWAKYRNDR